MYTIIFLAAFFAIASGHLIVENPKPFAFPAVGHFNPLEPDGTDWPCKMPSGTAKLEFNGTGPTLMKAGESQSLQFYGFAIHGGGSGQISLLPGHEPSKTNSDFRVIKSWEGGFPMANQKGNLEPGQNPSDKLEFIIPSTLPPGNYTGSISWLNKISGSPEMYQNCFPISIPGTTSGTPNKDALKELPPIFMANIGDTSKGCTTENGRAAQKAIQYPNPGSAVDHPEGTGNLIRATCDGNPLATAGSGSPTSASSFSPSSAAPALPASSSPVSVPTAQPSNAPTTFVTSVVPAISSSSSIAPQTPSASSPAPATPSGICTEGYLLCHPDGVSFSTCTGGNFIDKTPLASGTRCNPGAGQGLTITNFV